MLTYVAQLGEHRTFNPKVSGSKPFIMSFLKNMKFRNKRNLSPVLGAHNTGKILNLIYHYDKRR